MTDLREVGNAEHEANRIEDVGLARAVQARDGVEERIKGTHDRTLGIGFESVDHNLLRAREEGCRGGGWVVGANVVNSCASVSFQCGPRCARCLKDTFPHKILVGWDHPGQRKAWQSATLMYMASRHFNDRKFEHEPVSSHFTEALTSLWRQRVSCLDASPSQL